MEAQYALTVDDFVAFNVSYLKHSPTLRRATLTIYIIAWISVPAGIAIYLVRFARAVAEGPTTDSVAFLITWAIVHFAVFAFLVYRFVRRGVTTPGLIKMLIRHLIREGDVSSLVGQYRLTISSDSIAEISPRAEVTYQMTAVQKIEVTDQHAFVYVSPMQAFVIPRRAFSQHEDFEHFVQTMEGFSHVAATRT